MTSRILSAAILAAGLGLWLAPTCAQATGGPGACRDDLQKFCTGTSTGRSRRECLQQHAAALSPGCQERLKRLKARAATWSVACRDDVEKLCSTVDMAGGNVVRCLRQHRDDLSQVCRDQLGQHRPHRQASATP